MAEAMDIAADTPMADVAVMESAGVAHMPTADVAHMVVRA
jgi:hypothetical protein